MMHLPPDAFAHAAQAPRLRRADLRETPRLVRFLTWATAISATLALHVGAYLLATARDAPPPPPAQAPAAVMINLAPIAVTARSEVDNAAEGPPADAQSASEPPAPEMEPPPPPPAPEPILSVPPPPPEVKPQAVLPEKPPEPVKAETPPEPAKPRKPPEKERPRKPVEKPKPVVRKEKPAETREKPRAASRAGGGPRSDRHTAEVTAAPSAGSAAGEASRASWQAEVRAKIVRAKRFPAEARGQTGVAVVSVTFGPGGSASGVRLVASSGSAALDAEAVAVMYRAAPYPPPPGGRTTTLTVPLNFRR
ncbi:TonB family protein [Methylobacterium sp. WSM2598]|uniref:TonB family protein n=1 Tax=Methylobacterium sp. WSM2598 TaxID=398261 RepID=UPI00036B7370|nr:TonB family protein [Methylobacterium sp. WSM2598]